MSNGDIGIGQNRPKRINTSGCAHVGGKNIFLVLRNGKSAERKQRGGYCLRFTYQSTLPAK